MKVLFDNSTPGLNLMEVLLQDLRKNGDAKDLTRFFLSMYLY